MPQNPPGVRSRRATPGRATPGRAGPRGTRVGLISDTHGLLRPAVLDTLAGCEMILHAGDIGGPDILQALARIAPVVAVRGNNDTAPWARDLPETELVTLDEVQIYLIHDRSRAPLDLRHQGVAVVVSGHSHKPFVEERDGLLFINPGSAGPRRFKLPIAVGHLTVEPTRLSARIIEIANLA